VSKRIANGTGKVIERAGGDQVNHRARKGLRDLFVDECLWLKNTEEAALGEWPRKGGISFFGATSHIAGQQDRDLVEKEQKRLQPIGLSEPPIGLRVVIGNLRQCGRSALSETVVGSHLSTALNRARIFRFLLRQGPLGKVAEREHLNALRVPM
jgi:hypothetical protein